MDGDKLNRWVTLLANLGVIAGIVFLGIEIRQNNALLEAEAGYKSAQNRASNSILLIGIRISWVVSCYSSPATTCSSAGSSGHNGAGSPIAR